MNFQTTVASAPVDSLAFLAFPAKRAAQQVPSATEDMARSIGTIVSQIIARSLSARNAEEFRSIRDAEFARYLQVMIGFSSLLTASVESAVLDRLTAESLSEMEAELADSRSFFGEHLAEQAAFTVWTLGKISHHVNLCNAKKVARDFEEVDRQFAWHYVYNVIIARFNLDCLLMALREDKAIYPEVIPEIQEGLRAAVDAYAWVRQGSDLRKPQADEAYADIPWDEEQAALLAESTEEQLSETY